MGGGECYIVYTQQPYLLNFRLSNVPTCTAIYRTYASCLFLYYLGDLGVRFGIRLKQFLGRALRLGQAWGRAPRLGHARGSVAAATSPYNSSCKTTF